MMKHTFVRKQHNSKMCFVCGLKNGSGLQASFYETANNELVALFVPTVEHQSYPGRMHGGIASTILDETIGRAILVGRDDDVWGVTLELQVKYKKPIPLGTEIKVIARLTEEGNRFFKGSGEIGKRIKRQAELMTTSKVNMSRVET
jgi:acyl-coenzyme A thioesterase PaaI-like protein